MTALSHDTKPDAATYMPPEPADAALITALAQRMVAHPMLATEVVTGVAEWPSPDGDADTLAFRAGDLVHDYAEYRTLCPTQWRWWRHIQLAAAEQALVWISANEEAETRSEDDDPPYRNRLAEGWQGVLR